MNILYPINEKPMLRKARDARIMRMAAALASKGARIFLLIGKTTLPEAELRKYYGIPSSPNLRILPIPILRGTGVVRITLNQVFLWAAFWKARKISQKDPLDILYFSVLEVADFFLRRRNFFPRTKFVYELHELAIYPENQNPSPSQIHEDLLEKRVLAGMDGIFTTTAEIRRVVAERFPHLPSAAIPLGMMLPSDPPSPYNPGAGKAKIAYLGQLYPAQGIDTLLAAMALLPEAEAHIIGGKIDEVARFRKWTTEKNLCGRIVFHGFVEPGRVAAWIRDMDIFVVPSQNTIRMNYVAHIKIYEYMAARRPIVAARLRSVAEELEDGKTAILVEPQDPQALAAGIRRLIRDPDFAREIAERAYEQSGKYTWENRAERILDFIRSLK